MISTNFSNSLADSLSECLIFFDKAQIVVLSQVQPRSPATTSFAWNQNPSPWISLSFSLSPWLFLASTPFSLPILTLPKSFQSFIPPDLLFSFLTSCSPISTLFFLIPNWFASFPSFLLNLWLLSSFPVFLPFPILSNIDFHFFSAPPTWFSFILRFPNL